MDVQAAILTAVADRPADDTPRLAYADWLDDHAGDLPDPGAARVRAEFIRVQCEVKRLEHLPNALLQGFADLYRRQDHLRTHHRRDLLGPLADVLGPHDAVFDRGFVSELRLDDRSVLAHGGTIAALAPKTDVAVTAESLSEGLLRSGHTDLVTELRFLTIGGAAIDDRVPWPRWNRLRLLNISGCDAGDGSLSTISSTDHDLYPALTDLDISWNEVSDEGIEQLVRSPLWPRLRVLVVGSNPLSDVAADALADAPPTALQYLNIARTAITPQGQTRLLKRKGWKVDLF